MDKNLARKVMQEGSEKMRSKVVEMTNLLMDAYQEGFKTCFKVLTGEDIDMPINDGNNSIYQSKEFTCGSDMCKYKGKSPNGCGVQVDEYCPMYTQKQSEYVKSSACISASISQMISKDKSITYLSKKEAESKLFNS